MPVEQLKALLRDERGMTTVEYAVAAALLAIAVILAFDQLGGGVGRMIFFITEQLGGGGPVSPEALPPPAAGPVEGQ